MQLVDQAEQGLRLARARWPMDRHEARAAAHGAANRRCLRGIQSAPLRHRGAAELSARLFQCLWQAQQLVREGRRDVPQAPDGFQLSAAGGDAHTQQLALHLRARLKVLGDDPL